MTVEGMEAVTFLPGSPVEMYRDICKRTCMCRICEDKIELNTRRVVIWVGNLGGPITPMHGKGKIFARKFFFHPQCWSDYGLNGRPERKKECVDCGGPVQFGTFRVYRGRGRYGEICVECSRKKHWRYCHNCEIWWPRYEASELIESGFRVDRFACDNCVEEGDLLTVKVQKRLKKEAQP